MVEAKYHYMAVIGIYLAPWEHQKVMFSGQLPDLI